MPVEHQLVCWRSQNALLQSELRAEKAMESEAHQSLLTELARRDESIARLQRDLLQLQETREALLSEVLRLLSESHGVLLVHVLVLRCR